MLGIFSLDTDGVGSEKIEEDVKNVNIFKISLVNHKSVSFAKRSRSSGL